MYRLDALNNRSVILHSSGNPRWMCHQSWFTKGQRRGTRSAGTALEGVSRKAQPEENERAHSPHRLTLFSLPGSGAFILTQCPPGQSQLRIHMCHKEMFVTSSVPSPGGYIRRSVWSHFLPQSHIPWQSSPFPLPPPSAPSSVLCRTWCLTLQRGTWGPGPMTCLWSPCHLEKFCLKHSVCITAVSKSSCLRAGAGMNVTTENQAEGGLESLLVT